MSLSCLNNDMLIKIIQTITEEKNNEIKKLEEKLQTANDDFYQYQEALLRTGHEFYNCWKCKSCVIDLDEEDMDEECFQIRDGQYICCNCMEEINNNVDIQNEIMEKFTEYIVRINNNCYWNNNTVLKYKTYEEIPMCYKKSNICIEKEYYTDWEQLKQDDLPNTKIMNGDKNYSIKHANMLEELEEVFNINDIYLHSIIEIHRQKNKNNFCYVSDYWYRSIPIKKLLNVNSCGCEGEPTSMIGRSWYKCEGYTCSKCAYYSLITKYKKKHYSRN